MYYKRNAAKLIVTLLRKPGTVALLFYCRDVAKGTGC